LPPSGNPAPLHPPRGGAVLRQSVEKVPRLLTVSVSAFVRGISPSEA